MKKFIFFVLFVTFLPGCETAKEGLSMKKKDNSDEFLVEKKNPLVMPPEFSNLPSPDDFKNNQNENNEDEFEKIINTNEAKNIETNKKKTTIEQSILEKIN